MEIGNHLINSNSELSNKTLQGAKITEAVNPEAQSINAAESEMEITNPKEVALKTVVTDILKEFGFKVSEENLKLIENMVNHNLPVNKETLQKFNQALKLNGMDLSKALFFMKNEIPLNTKNSNALVNILDSSSKIMGQIENVIDGLDKIENTNLKNKVIDILYKGEEALGDKKIIENIVSSVKTSPMSEKEILKAFENSSLTSEGFKALAKTLLEEVPEHKELILRLSDEKMNFEKVIADNKPELAEKLTQALKSNELTPEKFTQIIRDVSKPLNNEPVEMKHISFKAKIFEPNEMKLILNSLFDENSVEKEELAKLLKLPADKISPTKETLLSKLAFDIFDKDMTTKEADKFLNQLKEKFGLVKEELLKGNPKETTAVLKEINMVHDKIDFMAQMKHNLFVQMPILLNNHETNAELFVFNDKKTKKDKSSSSSALIALDTANMGRFEVFVQKNSSNIVCQFRVESEHIEKQVKKNIEKLNSSLKDHGFSLETYTFKELKEPFTVLDQQPQEMKNGVKNSFDRFSLDLRT